MNKGDLIGMHGISVNQSSTDLNRYLNLAPENMEHDKSAKTFARKFGVEAQFVERNPSRYPSQLRLMSEGTRGSEPSETNNLLAADWHINLFLETKPRPHLPESRQNIITLDYSIHGDCTKIKVREALPYYALRILGFDTDPFAINNRDQKIVLLTKDEVLQ